MELVALAFCFWKSYIILIGFYSPFFYILFFNTDFEIKVQLSLLAIRSFDGRAAAVVQRLSFLAILFFVSAHSSFLNGVSRITTILIGESFQSSSKVRRLASLAFLLRRQSNYYGTVQSTKVYT